MVTDSYNKVSDQSSTREKKSACDYLKHGFFLNMFLHIIYKSNNKQNV